MCGDLKLWQVSETLCENDYVDGARLRLWTVATNGPIVHPAFDILARRIIVSNASGKYASSIR
jgi:hypothetical protein